MASNLPKNARVLGIDIEYEEGKINEWEPYEQVAQCCQEIPGADPCVDEGKVEPWEGFTLEEEGQDYIDRVWGEAKARHGDRLVDYEVEYVGGPPPGVSCGEKHTTWEGGIGCCDAPYPIVWHTTEDVIAVNRTYLFSVSGGVAPFSWFVVGDGLSISGGVGTAGDKDYIEARLVVDQCFCKPGLVAVMDSCGQVAINVVYLENGNNYSTTIDDAYYQSDFGWNQDGGGVIACSGGAVAVHGFNDDRTEWSTQLFGQICYRKANAQESDEDSIAGICAAGVGSGDYASSGAVSAPGDSEGYTKCPSGNVWYKDVSDQPRFVMDDGKNADFHAFYQTTSGVTKEYTHTCITNFDLLYDEDNSLTILADNSSGWIHWINGTPPFTVTVNDYESYDIWFDSSHTLEIGATSSRYIQIFSGNICGYSDITITDACGQSVVGEFQAADGQWQRDYGHVGAGALGDGDTQPPYEFDSLYGGSGEGCPVTFENSGIITVPKVGQTAKYKITQQYYQVTTCTYAGGYYETYAESVAHCSGVGCSDVALHPYRYIGGCFYRYEFCHICGSCGWASGLATNDCPGCSVLASTPIYDLGKNYSHRYHGEYTEPLYGYYFTYVYCQSTAIDIWVC